MNFPSFLLVFAGLAVTCAQGSESAPVRERISLNADWRFTKGDPSEQVANDLSYAKLKPWVMASANAFRKEQVARPAGGEPGQGIPYAQQGFNDGSWRKLNLPHDWAIESPFQLDLPGATGKLPFAGVGWYRKTFTLPKSDQGRRIYLDIDGAMAYSVVWCNGHLVGGWPYGYSSYQLDLSPYLKPGQDNQLAIRLSNPAQSSRWYPGSGIYRNVWLVKTNPVHVAHWGTYVTTPEVSPQSATVQVRTQVEPASAPAQVLTEIYELNADGSKSQSPVVHRSEVSIKQPEKEGVQSSLLKIANPNLWSCESPQLYVAVTTLVSGGKIVDRYETPFGIRTIKFTADQGFLLNGKRVPIKGVCNHHDLGALGAAFNLRAAQRQLEILKEMGCNALRTSHNPPAPELLDLCDRMGILVMDESFDCWEQGKRSEDYHLLWADWHAEDLRAEYRRDRNHPSVVMWSVGNEVRELGDGKRGPEIAAELTRIAHEEDPTRPTVVGSNKDDASYNGVQKSVDVMGQNYQRGGYERFRKSNPTIPLIGSETSSCVSSRGEYFFEPEEVYNARVEKEAAKAAAKGKPAPTVASYTPVPEDKALGRSDFQVSSYDLYAPGWAYAPDYEFIKQEQLPWVCGEFVWTGFDYLGEPTPYDADVTNLLNFQDPESKAAMERQLKELGKIKVPSRSSYFGIVDLAGFKKDRFYLYQAFWRPELPMAHILPHWNWPERVGKVTPVHVYTSGDEAELFLNGKSLGRKKKGQFEYRLRWNEVVYQPGELKVVAYKAGKPWAEDVVKTTGTASKLLLKADRSQIAADGADLAFVTATVADKDGQQVPRSKPKLTFSVEGAGELVATDNGDATELSAFGSADRKAFNGLALAIVRAKPGATGPITVKVKAEGMTGATATILAH